MPETPLIMADSAKARLCAVGAPTAHNDVSGSRHPGTWPGEVGTPQAQGERIDLVPAPKPNTRQSGQRGKRWPCERWCPVPCQQFPGRPQPAPSPSLIGARSLSCWSERSRPPSTTHRILSRRRVRRNLGRVPAPLFPRACHPSATDAQSDFRLDGGGRIPCAPRRREEVSGE